MSVHVPSEDVIGDALPAIAWLAKGVHFVNWRAEADAGGLDLGDLYNGTFLHLYPATQRNGFVYAEQLDADGSLMHNGWLWRSSLSPQGFQPRGWADGYDAPIGTEAERRAMVGADWPGRWFSAAPFGKRYLIGTPREAYHPGDDLNLAKDADAHAPVVACASGTVTCVGEFAAWGTVVVIRHDPLVTNNRVLFSRYGHVERVMVDEGQRVGRGEQIAQTGNAGGLLPYHLHFDISPTNVLLDCPQHWPKLRLDELQTHYVNPLAWIAGHRPLLKEVGSE